jgi:hypothetical protein
MHALQAPVSSLQFAYFGLLLLQKKASKKSNQSLTVVKLWLQGWLPFGWHLVVTKMQLFSLQSSVCILQFAFNTKKTSKKSLCHPER